MKLIPVKLTNKLASVPCYVDEQDFEKVSKTRWHLHYGPFSKKVYARGRVNGKNMRMHRLIMDAPANMDIDHINGNGLDNRRSNLRLCTETQNRANTGPQRNNTSGFKGVYKVKTGWRAAIKIKGKMTGIGTFKTKEEAATAYDEVARKLHGDFAKLNVLTNPQAS